MGFDSKITDVLRRMLQTGFIQIVLILGLLLGVLPAHSAHSVEVKTRLISLHQPVGEAPRINISKDSVVKVTNDFKSTLYGLKIVKVLTGKNMLRVDEFQPGQAFDLEFVQEGAYEICYSRAPKSESAENACVQIRVKADFKA